MKNLEKLGEVIDELEKQSNDLGDFGEICSDIVKLKEDIAKNLKLLEENNKNLEKITKGVSEQLDQFQKKVDEIYRDNKRFQKELDESIATRLEKHKSDIQIEIRNLSSTLLNGIETMINTEINRLESKIDSNFEYQRKQLQVIKVIAIVFSVLFGIAIGIWLID